MNFSEVRMYWMKGRVDGLHWIKPESDECTEFMSKQQS